MTKVPRFTALLIVFHGLLFSIQAGSLAERWKIQPPETATVLLDRPTPSILLEYLVSDYITVEAIKPVRHLVSTGTATTCGDLDVLSTTDYLPLLQVSETLLDNYQPDDDESSSSSNVQRLRLILTWNPALELKQKDSRLPADEQGVVSFCFRLGLWTPSDPSEEANFREIAVVWNMEEQTVKVVPQELNRVQVNLNFGRGGDRHCAAAKNKNEVQQHKPGGNKEPALPSSWYDNLYRWSGRGSAATANQEEL
jgi:hypothetical protein